MNTNALSPEMLHKMDAYWRAANYLSVGQIYLCDNPLLKRPFELANVKHLLLGHGGTNRKYHRLRQSSIDEELFDVISGFEALSNPRHRPIQQSHEDAGLSKVGP
jgi:hypothetical protein